MKESIKILALIAGILAWLLIGFVIGRRTARIEPETQVITQVDTCVIIDTIVREKPVYRYSYIIDTVHTYFTTIEHDSILVDVPIERKVYEEDSVYRLIVSGWRPNLDSLLIYNTTKEITVTKTIPTSRWSLGVTMGPSVLLLPHGEIHGGFGVTAGLQYRF